MNICQTLLTPGSQFLTLLSNTLSTLNLTDMEPCYKVFPREIIQKIKEDRFGGNGFRQNLQN